MAGYSASASHPFRGVPSLLPNGKGVLTSHPASLASEVPRVLIVTSYRHELMNEWIRVDADERRGASKTVMLLLLNQRI